MRQIYVVKSGHKRLGLIFACFEGRLQSWVVGLLDVGKRKKLWRILQTGQARPIYFLHILLKCMQSFKKWRTCVGLHKNKVNYFSLVISLSE